MPFIDFNELKARVSIEDGMNMLGLQMRLHGSQYRGPCPACDAGGDRALVITPHKDAWYCFAARKGGDVIALAAHMRDCGMKEAAELLAGEGTSFRRNSTNHRKSTSPEESERQEGHERGFQPLDYLLPTHELVQALGISPETCEHFGAGYAPRGILRARLAIPIHSLTGTLVAYCGRTVKDETPVLIFPKGFRPELYVFNLHRCEGELYTSNDPLDVLLAHENGVENMVSFLHKPQNVVEFKKRA
jgi:DNA primase